MTLEKGTTIEKNQDTERGIVTLLDSDGSQAQVHGEVLRAMHSVVKDKLRARDFERVPMDQLGFAGE